LLLEYGQLASLVTADERGWLALAYTIFIGGIVGFGLWFCLIARCSMGRVAPFGLLLPVFALIPSVLFLGDRVTPKLIVGALIAISGVVITQPRALQFLSLANAKCRDVRYFRDLMKIGSGVKSATGGVRSSILDMAEPEGFEPSIGLYNPITV
jgi:EamA-like transporter family